MGWLPWMSWWAQDRKKDPVVQTDPFDTNVDDLCSTLPSKKSPTIESGRAIGGGLTPAPVAERAPFCNDRSDFVGELAIRYLPLDEVLELKNAHDDVRALK